MAHSWDIPSLGLDAIITRNQRIFPFPDGPAAPFSISIVADEGGANPITTALSVTSFAGLDGAEITCSDANQIATETQNATVLVFGKCSRAGSRGGWGVHPRFDLNSI